MYMYLYHGMAAYFGESLDTIGPNLREVRPTIFVGVPRIFEKIFARVKEKTAEKGRLNVAILNWAVSSRQRVGQTLDAPPKDSASARVQTKDCRQADLLKTAQRARRTYSTVNIRRRRFARRARAGLHRRRTADRAGLRSD